MYQLDLLKSLIVTTNVLLVNQPATTVLIVTKTELTPQHVSVHLLITKMKTVSVKNVHIGAQNVFLPPLVPFVQETELPSTNVTAKKDIMMTELLNVQNVTINA